MRRADGTPDWLGRARRVENPVLEVGFIVWDDLYYGPENGFSAEEWNALREPLYRPALELLPRHVSYVLTSVLEPSVDELVRHYQDVLRLAEKHGREPSRSHFWLQPFIFSPGGLDIPFEWHDTADDAERVFSSLQAPDEGLLFHDLDEGWEVEVFASGDRLFIRHSDFTTETELACVWCDRAALVSQVEPLRTRLNAILAKLRAALGADYWSRLPIDFDTL
jgi:hypothetical protein